MLRVYKYLLRPNNQKARQLDFLLWQSRRVCNAALEQHITAYQETGKGLSYRVQWAHFRDQGRSSLETLGQLNASSIQRVLRRLDKSFAAYTLVAIENLSPAFMNRNRHLSRSWHDAGFGAFRHMLEHKAESAGIPVIAVNPLNTTRMCSECGRLVPKDLSVRVYKCPGCGLILDRKVNAARNILNLAI